MILIAIGGNLVAPDGRTPHQVCNDAVDALSRLPGLRLASRSSWYRSAPVPRSEQPDYVNGVVRLDAAPGGSEPEPVALLAMLQAIEASLGRERSVPAAARTLDLDIVAMGDPAGGLVRDRPDPILPHPRAHLRAFVMLPLRDVAQEWVHPRLGAGVDRLLADLPEDELLQDRIEVIPGS